MKSLSMTINVSKADKKFSKTPNSTLSYFDTLSLVPFEITQYDKKTFRKSPTYIVRLSVFRFSVEIIKMYRRLTFGRKSMFFAVVFLCSHSVSHSVIFFHFLASPQKVRQKV